MKLLGAIMIAVCILLIGMKKACFYDEKAETMEKTIFALEYFSGILKTNGNSLYEIISIVCENTYCKKLDYFYLIKAHMENNFSFSESLDKAMTETMLPFAENDRAIIKALGNILGKADMDNQLKLLENTINTLKISEKILNDEKNKNTTIIKKLAVLTSIAVFIILI